MADKMFENNQVSIIGEIVSDFQFSHEVYGEGFYMMEVSVRRLSDCMDYIPVMVSERLINVEGDYIGKSVYIGGQFRSFNRHEEKKNRLVLSVFARELEVLDSDYDEDAANQIFLDGYICKEAIYRKTPLGREIADLLVAVNRSYGKSDYIPCICWGRNARFASTFEVGTHVQIWGRIQSRDYVKKLSETQEVERTKYEAEHDLLTGMYNKTAGMQRIREYIDNMTDEDSASLVFVDIDDFKSVNDTYGHAVGDYWIEKVAKFLRSDCYEEDVACRYGGDEYVVLHKGLSDISVLESKVIRFARKLQRKAMERVQNVHCSAGICQINGSGFSTEECMNVADTALYEAKKKGKNASVIHSISRDGTDRVTVLDKIETDIKKAQSRVEARISYMYTDIIYVNYENNKYRVIKGDSELNNAVSCANNYDEVIGLISNRFESDRSRKIVRDFLSRERMESYTGGNMGYIFSSLCDSLKFILYICYVI